MTPGAGRHHLSQRRRMKKWRSQRRPATALPWPRSPLMSWVYYFRSLAKWPNVCILKAFRTDWPRLTQIDPYHTIYTSYHKSYLIKKKGCLHVSNFWTASMGHSAHSAWRGRFQGTQGPMNLVRFQKNRPIGTRFWGLWKAEQTIAKHTIDQTVDAKIHVSIGFWMQWIIVFMCGHSPQSKRCCPIQVCNIQNSTFPFG
jgi:hypothetical protein